MSIIGSVGGNGAIQPEDDSSNSSRESKSTRAFDPNATVQSGAANEIGNRARIFGVGSTEQANPLDKLLNAAKNLQPGVEDLPTMLEMLAEDMAAGRPSPDELRREIADIEAVADYALTYTKLSAGDETLAAVIGPMFGAGSLYSVSP